MTSEQIQSFLAVIQYGSLNKAAEQLYITQPALGYRIAALEKELGGPLISHKKGSNKISVTSLGMKFLPQAEKLSRLFTETSDIMRTNDEEKIYFAASSSLSITLFWDLYHAVQRHLDTDEMIRFSLSTLDYIESYTKVESGEIDLAFVIYTMYSPHVTTVPLAKEELVLCCHPDAPFPDHLKVHDLDPSREVRLIWAENFMHWHNKHFDPNTEPFIQTNQAYSGARFLEHENTWAFFPMGIAERLSQEGEVRILTLSSTPPPRTINLIYNRNRPHRHLDLIMQTLDELILTLPYLIPEKQRKK